jgi:hypothetical protein
LPIRAKTLKLHRDWGWLTGCKNQGYSALRLGFGFTSSPLKGIFRMAELDQKLIYVNSHLDRQGMGGHQEICR